MKVALISDTHLTPGRRSWSDCALLAMQAANALKPDLVVNGGDISANGADDAADLRFAFAMHDAIEAPLAFIPGNHDVGEEPGAMSAGQPISEARLARYRGVFGADRWARDLGAWRLIGLNSLLVGSELKEEAKHWAWLKAELAAGQGRPIGVFQHKPLWLEHPDDAPAPLWTIAPNARARVYETYRAAGVRFVASGHLHQFSARKYDDEILHVWAPSAAFSMSHDFGGDAGVGFAMLELGPDGGVSASHIKIPLAE